MPRGAFDFDPNETNQDAAKALPLLKPAMKENPQPAMSQQHWNVYSWTIQHKVTHLIPRKKDQKEAPPEMFLCMTDWAGTHLWSSSVQLNIFLIFCLSGDPIESIILSFWWCWWLVRHEMLFQLNYFPSGLANEAPLDTCFLLLQEIQALPYFFTRTLALMQ